MSHDEWGWFIDLDISYIDEFYIETKKTRSYNKKIKQKRLYKIEEEEYRILEWLRKLDNKIDLGNLFATGVSNTILLCVGGMFFFFNRKSRF